MDSPSGKIRQAIGLAKRRLQDALRSYLQIQKEIDLNPAEINDEQLYNTFETAHDVFRRLSRNVQRLDELHNQWQRIIETNPSEQTTFDNYITAHGDFRSLVEEGRAAVDHLRLRIGLLREAASNRLELTDPNDLYDNGEGTLDIVPSNDAVFSTPTTPTRPSTPATPATQVNPPAELSQPSPGWMDLLFLPNVSIPQFNGNPSRWNEFWDLFNAMVNNRKLEPCLKLFQLRSCLEGEAKAALSHLGNSNADYNIAVQTLKDLYGDPLRVTHRLRAEILQFRILDKGSINLYRGWSRLHQLYSQLLSMGDPADTTLLAQVIESKFPRYVLQKVYKDATIIPKGKQMLDAVGDVLRKEANIDRMISDNHGDQKRLPNRPNTPRRPDQVLSHYNADQDEKNPNGPSCHLCEGRHLTYKCSKYGEPQERQRQASLKKLCRNCLLPGHFVPECPSKHSCRHCNQRHHSSMCFRNNPAGPSRPAQKSKPAQKVTFAPKPAKTTPSAKTRPPSNPRKEKTHVVINEDELDDNEQSEQAFLTNTKPKPKLSTTLLMTTEVEAINPDVSKVSRPAVLFSDSGSTRSFITEELASNLKLRPLSDEITTVNVNTFGDHSETFNTKTYNLVIRDPAHPKKTTKISVLSIPNMTSSMLAALPTDFHETPLTVKKVRPSILLGMDNLDICRSTGEPVDLPSGFKLSHSKIGRFIYGEGKASPVPQTNAHTHHSYMMEMAIPLPTTEGSITAIAGPMWSGKTTLLLEKLNEFPEQSRILRIRHVADIRYTEGNQIVTHDGQTHACMRIADLNSTIALLNVYDVLAIDDAHFFPELAVVCQKIRDLGKTIIVTGLLNGTYLDNPTPKTNYNFAPLWAIADLRHTLLGNCDICGEPASYSKRIVPNPTDPTDISQWVGGKDKYATLCPTCDTAYTTKHSPQVFHISIPTEETPNDSSTEPVSICVKHTEQKQLSSLLTKFWTLEHLGIHDDPSRNDDDLAMEAFLKTVTRDEEGRYVCRWPWKGTPTTLQSNFGRCLGRLRSTLRRLSANPTLLQQYSEIFSDQLTKGIIEEVPLNQPSQGPLHYIPHQPVITPDKTTTKLRVVYDASCKTPNGKSLNDHMFRGPVLLPELVGMLLRFRVTKIPLLSDVEKAFLQLSLDERDRDCTRFLWVRDVTQPAEGANLMVFRFNRVCFGVVSSPFLLAACVDYHLQHYPHPLAKAMRKNSYVDNVLIECSDVQEATDAYHLSRQIFSEAKMNLREFQSSHPTVKAFLEQQGEKIPEIVKFLGLQWNTNTDILTLVPWKTPNSEQLATKRTILKRIASLFDPLGFHAPLILQAKLLLQKLWQQGKDWDIPLQEDLLFEWNQIQSLLETSTMPTLQRHVCPFSSDSAELHVFCDASDRAYAAVAYLRTQSGDLIDVSFLIGKSRLGPIKGMTVPRLELLGLLIGSNLARTIATELPSIRLTNIFLWTDSRIVHTWLLSRRTLPIFVKNRVNSIWQNVPNASIRYVPTAENPADSATKRCPPSQLWLEGPAWLRQSPSQWPNQPELYEAPEDITAVAEVTTAPIPLIDATRFSRWTILIHTLVCVLQYLATVLSTSNTAQRKYPWLSVYTTPSTPHTTQFHTAEKLFFRLMQQERPPTKAQQHELNLYQDSEQVFRCRTRLAHASLPTTAQNPIFLPSPHYGTALYIHHIHQLLGHASTSTTLCHLRYRVWIPKARRLVQSSIRQCSCRTLKPFALPPFPNYPHMRVQPNPPFHYTGLDYGGPISVSITTTDTIKTYICLFTCLTSRAVHLELVLDLSTLAFLQALRKFISRRGTPAEVWSDNAPQFRLATQAITLAWAESEDVQSYLATRGIKWSFITESAPWQGGSWERLMGVTKTALKRAIGKKKISLPEMMTVLTEVEAIVNSRPLTFVPSKIDDQSFHPIRPIDCIQPGAFIGVPLLDPWDPEDGTFEPKPSSVTKLMDLWRKQQRIINQFWKIWSSEYLLTLAERHQTTHKQDRSAIDRLPMKGEVVLVHEEGLGRGKWQMAKILEIVTPNKIQIQLATPPHLVLHRSPKHLYPLELQPEIPNATEGIPRTSNQHDSPPPPRRSPRKNSSSTTLVAYFLGIVLINTVSATESLPNPCTAEDCAPWRWDCCTAIQKTGIFIWMGVLLALIPFICILLAIHTWIWRTVRWIWTRCRPQNPRQPRYQAPHRIRRLLRTTGTIYLLFGLFPWVNGCSEVTALTASTHNCRFDEDSNVETCSLSQSIQLSLRPINETSCLRITTPLNGSYMLRLTTLQLKFKCNFKYGYHTRDFATTVESVHRCDMASNSYCQGYQCEKVSTSDDLPEFSLLARRAPGYSHCTRACGCATCGCFLCSPGCNFWRLYALPKTNNIYLIGRCPTWTITASVILEVSGKTSLIQLVAAKPVHVGNEIFTLQAISTPQVPILYQPMVIKVGTNEAITTAASDPQQPAPGSLGVFQCRSEDDARRFQCTFPHETCSCSPSDFHTKCTCNYRNPMDLWHSPEVKLPFTSGPIKIAYQNHTITAEIAQQTAILVHIAFQNATISTFHYRAKCAPSVIQQLTGCKSCHSGAQAIIFCQSKFPTTINVECDGTNVQSSPCNNITFQLNIHTDEAEFNKNCSYSCSDKSDGTLHLFGKLHTMTIPPPRPRNLDSGGQEPPMKFRSETFYAILHNFWKKSLGFSLL
ncbi:unnamed protein product [Bursaphelenchus xylophilus]|uniref:Thymidine kinase, cytosolic n=1 Tax=Bursaphelenchus xylophilus TaxID=6326 RepID=A0A811JWZ9_BURXY|nr:unnamed protein product [Bursaphelenchus xylophilus]CAG9079127.1 unnamed protein product [Bursaphelenchus xylophilus]